MKDILSLFGQKQFITPRVTPESRTLIDIVLSNTESVVSFKDVIPLDLNDYVTIA